MTCDCEELTNMRQRYQVDPRYVAIGAYHDCAYVRMRTGLVPISQRYADTVVPQVASGKASVRDRMRWTQAFAARMEVEVENEMKRQALVLSDTTVIKNLVTA